MKTFRKVLSIAGSDSGGGAGIQADIKTISACGCYAMTAITAVTAQNTQRVYDVHVVPVDIVEKQITTVIEDIGVDAVKLGMLPTEEIIVSIARLLNKYGVKNIVMDPVMVATSGDRLISDAAAEAIKKYIFPIATLVTPNIPELEYITGLKIHSEKDFPEAADALRKMGAKSVLLKAGHLMGTVLTDYLYVEGDCSTYSYDYIDTPNTHGTGCTLSSAIASYYALGYKDREAVGLAEDYIHKAILNGAQYRTGKGHGPLHHFFRFWE